VSPPVRPEPGAFPEAAFQAWYRRHAERLGLNPDPDDPQHFYDYRAAFRAGAEPDAEGHFPSAFKLSGHPNLVVGGVDTRTGLPPGGPILRAYLASRRRQQAERLASTVQQPDVLPEAPSPDVPPETEGLIAGLLRGPPPEAPEIPMEVTAGRPYATAADVEGQRYAAALARLQEERARRASRLGPAVAGAVEGFERAVEPVVGLGAAATGQGELVDLVRRRARERRALAEAGYALPSEPTTLFRAREAGPIARALGARTVAESGELAGGLVGTAPAFVAAAPAARPLAALARRGVQALGGRGVLPRATEAAVQGIGEFGLGSAAQAGAEAALAGATPADVIAEATEAGLHGATTPLALIHVPRGIARGRAIAGRTSELRERAAARSAADLQSLVPGAARLPVEPGVATGARQAANIRAQQAEAATFPINAHDVAELATARGVPVEEAAARLRAQGYAVTDDMITAARPLAETASRVAREAAERGAQERAVREVAGPATAGEPPAIEFTADAIARRQAEALAERDARGAAQPEALGAAAGGVGGAAVGAATGDTPEERLARGIAFGAGGAVAGGAITAALRRRLGKRGATTVRPEPPAAAPEAAAPVVPVAEPAPAAPPPARPPVAPAARRAQPPVDVDEYVNLAKFDTDPGGTERLKAEVERIVTTTDIHPKERVPWSETRRLASQIGLDLTDPKTGRVNQRLTGPEMLATRNLISANIDALERLVKERADPLIGADRLPVVERNIAAIEAQNARLLERFIRARTHTGRDLNNLKIVANRTLDPAVWVQQARKLAGRDLTAEEITTISRLAQQRDRPTLVRTVAGLRHSTAFEKATTLWKAGLLTNPKTHLVNITSNTTMAALETAKDPVAALADILLSQVSGVRTKGGWNAAMARASAKGVAEGVREAQAVLRGLPSQEALLRYDLPRETNFGNHFLDAYTKTVFRLLGAEDRVFWWAAFRRSMAEQGTLAGKQQGLRGVELRQYVDGLLRGEGTLADELSTRAMADADVATFRNRTQLGEAASGIVRNVPVFHFVMPFTRTPSAVATSVLEYSPAGLGKAVVWDLPRFLNAVAKGEKEIGGVPLRVIQRELSESVGRGTVGSAAIWLGWLLAGDDLATGAAPTFGGQERQQWLQQNRQPNSVKIGDQWYAVGRISPVGNLIALGANLRHIWRPGGALAPTERYGELVASALRTVADQPFLTGVSGALGAIQEPEREAARFAQGLAASVVPAAVGAVARGTDVPRIRELEGPGGQLVGPVVERIPGLRTVLPEQVSPLGETTLRGPRGQPGRLLDALFNPFTAAPDLRQTDPVIRELADAGYAVPRLPREEGEGAVSYSRRSLLYGRLARGVIAAAIASPAYEQARAAEAQLATDARRLAQDPRWQEFPEERIRQALEEALRTASPEPVTRAELLASLVMRVRREVTRARAAAP
jgi:hypothetical protein